MDYKKIFYDELKDQFLSRLRGEGFKGSGQNFRRIQGEVVHTVNIQSNKYGGSCCLNLGLHLTFLPVIWDSNQVPDLQKIKVIDCEFQDRMVPEGKADYWWKYKGNGFFGSTRKSVSHLCQTYENVGRGFFMQYASTESVVSKLPIDLLKNSEFIDSLGGVIPVRGALTMARIYKHLGDLELQKEYAKTGLAILGNATSLKKELESLAE